MSPDPSAGGGDAARLTARPAAAGTMPGRQPPGLHALDLDEGPAALLYVPTLPDGAAPPRLVLTLHGAGGNADRGMAPLRRLADAHGLLLLAPASTGSTWDAVLGGWGPDVRQIDQALARVFAANPVDPRVAVSGFSDGATYALSLGLANADLFSHVVAFSPGFVATARRVGTPRVFVSHGLHDQVLPIDETTRRIVPRLLAEDVPTELRVFDGPHAVPPEIADEAVRWLLA